MVQDCIKKGTADQRSIIIDTLVKLQSSKVIDLMKHMYGNYVIQTALEYANEAQKSRFIKYVRESKDLLKKVRYGKHIISKVDSITYNRNHGGNN